MARSHWLMKSLAFESPTARRTVLDLFSVSLARLEIIEEHPSVLAFYPPKLSPKLVRLATRTIQFGHRIASLCEVTLGYCSIRNKQPSSKCTAKDISDAVGLVLQCHLYETTTEYCMIHAYRGVNGLLR
jgi:hypothetical protein